MIGHAQVIAENEEEHARGHIVIKHKLVFCFQDVLLCLFVPGMKEDEGAKVRTTFPDMSCLFNGIILAMTC